MRSITRRHCLTCLAASVAAIAATAWQPAAAQPIDVITLRYRKAEDILPLLQPFIEPGGALTGQGKQLFIRTSERNRRQIDAMIAQLDRAPRQLLITVRQGSAAQNSDARRDVQGRISLNSRGLSGQGSIYINDEHRSQSGGLEQRVQVIEGGQASLSIGTAIPFTFHHWQPMSGGRWVQTEHTVYYEAISGFRVRPTLAGELVTLEISPQSDSGALAGGPSMRLATEIQVRLGQWSPLGSADAQAAERRRDLLSSHTTEQSSQRSVWVKVDLLSP